MIQRHQLDNEEDVSLTMHFVTKDIIKRLVDSGKGAAAFLEEKLEKLERVAKQIDPFYSRLEDPEDTRAYANRIACCVNAMKKAHTQIFMLRHGGDFSYLELAVAVGYAGATLDALQKTMQSEMSRRESLTHGQGKS